MKISVEARNEMLSVIGSLLNGGTLTISSGDQPNMPESSSTGDILAVLQFDIPAFQAAAAGSIIANPMSGDESARASGSAGWFRAESGGVVVLDGTVGVADSDLNLSSVEITTGARVDVTNMVITLPLK